jgi:DNA-binding NtrC family response regulator
VRVPALRERPEDVRPLAELFLRRMSGESKRPCKPFSAEALDSLVAYRWPGNIRELRNVVERAILFANGPEITPGDLGLTPAPRPREAAASLPHEILNLQQLEQWAIETALERCDWVQNKAAALLGISPRALSYKLDKLDPHNPALQARRRSR